MQPMLLLFCLLICLGFLIESVLSVLKVDSICDDADSSERNTERETSHKNFVERRLKGGRILLLSYFCVVSTASFRERERECERFSVSSLNVQIYIFSC